MKYILFLAMIGLAACANRDLRAHLEAEQDFHDHQQYLESIYNLDNYHPEYVADCLYYEELVCEFE